MTSSRPVMLRNNSSNDTVSGRSSATKSPASASTFVTWAASLGATPTRSNEPAGSTVSTSKPAPTQHVGSGDEVVESDQQRRAGGRRQDVVDAAAQYEAAPVDDGHVVARLLDLGQQVAGQEHGAPFSPEPPQQLADLADARRVEAVDRLVEHEQRGILQERTGQTKALAHTERVLADLLVRTLQQTDRVQARLDSAGSDPVDGAEQLQVLACGHRREHRRRLHDGADAGQHGRQLLGRGTSEHGHPPSRGGDEAEQAPDRRRLARAIGAEEPEHATLRHGKVQPLDGDVRRPPPPPVLLAQPLDVDHRTHDTDGRVGGRRG